MRDPEQPPATQDDQDEADSQKSMSSISARQQPWMRFAGMGLELASYTLGLGGIGYVADWYIGLDSQLGTAFGTLIGFSFGMFRFIQQASAANRSDKPVSANSAESPRLPSRDPKKRDDL